MARMTSRDFPEYFQSLYATALDQKVEVPCDTANLAINLQHKLHRYRKALRDEGNPLGTRFNDVIVSRDDSVLILSNQTSAISKALNDLDLKEKYEPSEDELDAYIAQLDKHLGEES